MSTASPEKLDLVLGVDLDGVCADFDGQMKAIVAEWTGRPVEELTADPDPGFRSWGLEEGEYEAAVHRFAVVERQIFKKVKPIDGAPQAIRELDALGLRIRIITHRLYAPFAHELAVTQTVRWLDNHGIPYWDLCFLRDKAEVGADLYIEDNPGNVANLIAVGKEVIVFAQPQNVGCDDRFDRWDEVVREVRRRFKLGSKDDPVGDEA